MDLERYIMKSTNLISACQSYEINTRYINDGYALNNVPSKNDYKVLKSLCNDLQQNDCSMYDFSGYYIGYKINQISKEFDLLRFSSETIINIELKSELKQLTYEEKIEKIRKQMSQNYYYLKFIEKEVIIYTYIENDGIYKYDIKNNKPEVSSITELIHDIKLQKFRSDLDPDKLFVPKNYLVSPFNKTKQFINGEYFLTNQQSDVKKEIIKDSINKGYFIACISANAGTGKTLLIYDIARSFIEDNKTPLIIHTGILNDGHEVLNKDSNWNIHSVRDLNKLLETQLNDASILIVDESHRLTEPQLHMIYNATKKNSIPTIFAYDIKQYLKENESIDIYHLLLESKCDNDCSIKKYELTNKIRTNKNLSSFIKNLMIIGTGERNINYDDISIEYFDCFEDLSNYISYLQEEEKWKAITYTNSRFTPEPLDKFANICELNAHKVIGQEFDKVVFIMDDNFKYGENGKLLQRKNYYSPKGMLYQIVTRAVSELKIVVYQNEDLYYQIQKIKNNVF